jgi:RNA polymerase sigma factor (sigma-70 family)
VSVAAVAAAAHGDQGAWNELVESYTPLVLSVIRRHRLSDADGADVYQTLWLRLVEHLDRIHEPQALPMWIITTTRNECLRLLRLGRRIRPVDPLTARDVVDQPDDTELEDELLETERHQVLREGFAQLPHRCQTLLAMFVTDPPLSYAEIGQQLGMPHGSIGTTRTRCIDKLRKSPAVVAFLDDARDSADGGGGPHDVATLG